MTSEHDRRESISSTCSNISSRGSDGLAKPQSPSKAAAFSASLRPLKTKTPPPAGAGSLAAHARAAAPGQTSKSSGGAEGFRRLTKTGSGLLLRAAAAARPESAPSSPMDRSGSMREALRTAPCSTLDAPASAAQPPNSRTTRDCYSPLGSPSARAAAAAGQGQQHQEDKAAAEQAVAVALHIRPLSDKEALDGCQHLLKVSPVAPEVRCYSMRHPAGRIRP